MSKYQFTLKMNEALSAFPLYVIDVTIEEQETGKVICGEVTYRQEGAVGKINFQTLKEAVGNLPPLQQQKLKNGIRRLVFSYAKEQYNRS